MKTTRRFSVLLVLLAAVPLFSGCAVAGKVFTRTGSLPDRIEVGVNPRGLALAPKGTGIYRNRQCVV